MSEALPSTGCCALVCADPVSVTIPGPTGPEGPAGADGTDGVNAFTELTALFTMPAYGASDDAFMLDASFIVVGQPLFIEGLGTLLVTAKSGNTVTLQNLADGADAYPGNAAPGAFAMISSHVTPTGLQGAAGPAPAAAAPDDATYLLQVANAGLPNAQAMGALATGLVTNTNGTGVQTVTPLGIANGNVAPVASGGGLVNGNVVFGNGSGLETKTPAAARNALGLAKGIADTLIPPVDDAAGLTAGELVRATANGLESIDNATVLAQLGITGVGGMPPWLVYHYEEPSATDGALITQVGWRLVPLNTEVVDTGNNGTIAASIITLTAGTYRARWRVSGWEVENMQSRLYGVTAVAPLGYGTNARSAAADVSCLSVGECRFTVGASGQIQLEVQVQLTNIYGKANSFGANEIYGVLELEKET